MRVDKYKRQRYTSERAKLVRASLLPHHRRDIIRWLFELCTLLLLLQRACGVHTASTLFRQENSTSEDLNEQTGTIDLASTTMR